MLPVVVFLCLCALWELIVYLGDYPAFFLPSPRLVWARALVAVRDGSLLARFGSRTAPDDPALVTAVEQALSAAPPQ